MSIHSSVLELIGHTPIVRSRRLDAGGCELLFKLESANPGGSIKDRIALAMIEAAERRGDIAPGATLVDGTTGNTGLGLALVARQKGYRLLLVVPDRVGREKLFNLKAMGAEVVSARADVPRGDPEHYLERARRIAAETPGAYFIDQAGNADNPAAHEVGTAAEILEQLDGRLDAVVVGCGSGGTLTGLARAFARLSPATEIVLADPVGSVLAACATGAPLPAPGHWLVEGIGGEVAPAIADFGRVARAYSIEDGESLHAARSLLREEGILAGPSTGTLLAAALRYCHEQTTPKRVLVPVCDTGNKYLSTLYNDDWMADHGFLERPQHGDLRDLIQRPYHRRDTVVVAPDETLTIAYQRMKLYDVSQLPVMEGDRLVGIVDESDVLLHVYGDEARFDDPVSQAMAGKLEKLDVHAPVEALLSVFDRGRVAIVMDGPHFLGLITRIDLLNWLRRRVQ